MDILRNPETALSAACQEMRHAAAKLLARAQDAAVIRPDLTITELLCLTNGVAVAAERHPQETARLLSLLIEGLHCQVLTRPAACSRQRNTRAADATRHRVPPAHRPIEICQLLIVLSSPGLLLLPELR
jgi:hypothetical protein